MQSMSDQDEEMKNSKNAYCHDSTSDNLNNLEESSSTINGQAEGKETLNRAEKRVQTFFTEKKIFKLFNFLICHLLVDEPNDPIEYLYDLIDRCVLFRSGLVEAPLLFDKRHIESIFQSMDPTASGNITLDGYRNGMTTLGIESFDKNPRESLPGYVDKNFFVNEAEKCLVKMLSEMIEKSDERQDHRNFDTE